MPRTLSAQTCSTTTAPLSITATRCSLSSSPPERSSGTTTATSRCALRIQCYDNVTRALCIVLHYCHGSSRGCYTTVTAPHVGGRGARASEGVLRPRGVHRRAAAAPRGEGQGATTAVGCELRGATTAVGCELRGATTAVGCEL
eukprot:3344335-Pyramimonas_sp.AAC.1